MRRSVAIGTLVVTALFAGACGGGTATVAKPARVPEGLVPASLNGGLNVSEYLPGRSAFAKAGASSLVSDGRVWELRRGATLVGTLQISTVKPDVSVDKKKDRAAILDGVMTGTSFETVYIDGIRVSAATAADKTLYLWFGPERFEVLQLKGSKVDPEAVAKEIIEFQKGKPAR